MILQILIDTLPGRSYRLGFIMIIELIIIICVLPAYIALFMTMFWFKRKFDFYERFALDMLSKRNDAETSNVKQNLMQFIDYTNNNIPHAVPTLEKIITLLVDARERIFRS